MTLHIATAAYPLDWHDSWDAYEAKVTGWVEAAVAEGAQLLVFPEYGAMELASLGGAEAARDLEAALQVVARYRPEMETLFIDLAFRHRVHILVPSGPVIENHTGADIRTNRATLVGPAGLIGHQDKAVMTRFEREDWQIGAGEGLQVFDTALGRIGITICYDSEFPLLARALCEKGAEILLVPSCTDTVAGYSRVRIGAQARALENQCVTVQSPTVGDVDWCPAVDTNRGAAGVFGPPDTGWPETGVLAEGGLDSPGWVHAQVDLDRVRQSRHDGGVLLFQHWPESADQAETVAIVRETAPQP
ncbi:carbon-nitrogen hydrolase family protein [Thioclava sp. GXIMD4215]|uniref:carbon-nitrogen hydrolase family protein n=1 Tax=Thioclava sp. GXIMD4215 TaxID=3131928 RepID=UPI00324FD5DF